MNTQKDIASINKAATEADRKLGEIDHQLGVAAERNGVGDHAAGGAAMNKAHLMLGSASMSLARVARMAVSALAGAATDVTGGPAPDGNVTWQRPDGSTASVPPPQPGEGIMSYAARVSAETGYPANAVGAIAQMSSTTPFKDWPHIVDYLADPKRYGVTTDPGANEDTVFAGSIDPATLTLQNWAYFGNHNLGSKAGQIFSGRLSDMNREMGKYHGGDLATATEEAGPLAAFG